MRGWLFHKYIPLFVAALCSFVWGGLPVSALAAEAGSTGERVLVVRNDTGTDLYGLFFAPAQSTAGGAATRNWGADLLDGNPLRQGGDVNVTFPWGARAIWWDVRAENREGGSVEWKNIPLRRFRTVTLYFQGASPMVKGE